MTSVRKGFKGKPGRIGYSATILIQIKEIQNRKVKITRSQHKQNDCVLHLSFG